MNIIIPLCGIGKRFQDAGYSSPKPLIDVLDKKMIDHVIDSLDHTADDKLFIIYHTSLDNNGFSDHMKQRYPSIHLLPIYKRTDGAAETIQYGIQQIHTKMLSSYLPTLLIDCDTIYHVPILEKLRAIQTNATICFEDTGSHPIYSYITVESNNRISDIKEKERISPYANTGAYFFQDINELHDYCELVIQQNIRFKNEYYISCVIKEMVEKGKPFTAIPIKKLQYQSLGTPEELICYLQHHQSFLFDLDGTLVKTDTIYHKVWKEILVSFHIPCTETIFNQYIQGNNDAFAMQQLKIDPASYQIEDISALKDRLFRNYLDEIEVIDGAVEYIKKQKEEGNSVCIVTNCNRDTCEAILTHIGIRSFINYIIIGNECSRPKPYPDPYLAAMRLLKTTPNQCTIFEDSKSGLLSAQASAPRMIVGVNNGTNERILRELNIKMQITSYNNMNIDSIANESSDYLTQMIHQSLCHKYSIQDIRLDTQKLKGGYISDVIRVQIKLTSGETLDTVLKYENDYTSSLTKMAYTLGLFDREYYFYEQIRDYVSICAPKYIGTIKDSNFVSKGILLENINQPGMVLNLDLNKESVDVSLKVIEQCAIFHSQFWNKDLSKSFKDLKKHNDPLFRPVWGDFLRERWPLFSEKWKHIISLELLTKMKRVVDRFEEIQDYLSKDNLTVCHGDVKSGNMFYKKQEHGYMPYFIDWQYLANGKGVQDIVFFMMESFSVENIKAYYELFKMYYYMKIKENGIHYSMEAYQKDFEYAICYFPLFVAVWFGTTPTEELIDVSFPFLFIQKFVAVFENSSLF